MLKLAKIQRKVFTSLPTSSLREFSQSLQHKPWEYPRAFDGHPNGPRKSQIDYYERMVGRLRAERAEIREKEKRDKREKRAREKRGEKEDGGRDIMSFTIF